MRRIHAIGPAIFLLAFGMTATAGAQGKHGNKPAKAPHEQKPHVEKQAPAPHVEKTVVKHVEKPAPAPHVERTVVKKVAPVSHVVKREVVVARGEQQARLRQQQNQALQYRRALEQQTRLAQLHQAQLAKQNRKAYLRFLQQYNARLAQQQRQLLVAHNYSSDRYITSPYTYQYVLSGTPRYTNQYGADVLKQAVNYGYQEGYQAGQADRQDGWAADYRNSYAYTDANYGYNGYYVSQSDYNYYFRQGFHRGYSDGYYSRSQYGNSLNGSTSILGSVLSALLNFTSLR
jgi:hypothetical protein